MLAKTVGDYHILSKIGTGGSGTVYLAEHLITGEKFAVKALAVELTDVPDFQNRFDSQVSSLYGLKHPNIAQLRDFLEVDGQFFLITDYVASPSLKTLLNRNGVLAEEFALIILRGILKGLNFAHSKNVLHRNLKPSNIFLVRDGESIIMDFNIPLISTPGNLTEEGNSSHFLPYMSPELPQHPRRVDHRADVYSAGMILHQMLTGMLPLEIKADSKTDNEHFRNLGERIASQHNTGNLPRSLSDIILKALEQNPDDRFNGCGDFIQYLDAYKRFKVVKAAPPSPHVPPTLKKKKVGLKPAFATLGVLLSIALLFMFFRDRTTVAPPNNEGIAAQERVIKMKMPPYEPKPEPEPEPPAAATIQYPPISPFSKHEERYRALYGSLVEGNMDPARIVEIFSSEKAKKIDMTPVERLSKRVFSKQRERTKKQLVSIARDIGKHLDQYERWYDALERDFGLNREIAAAILYKETSLGRYNKWQHEAFTTLNSILGFLAPPKNGDSSPDKRTERVVLSTRKSLEGLLLYCDQYGIDITNTDFPSSFAGAIGNPQFMPMYMEYAVSADDSVPNLSKMPDAILSVGNIFQNRFGWPRLMELNKLSRIDEIREKFKIYDQQKGVSFCMSKHLDGYPLRRFVDDYPNIPHISYIAEFAPSIMHYNFSSVYTLDVLQFAFYTSKIRSK